jgi:hypothetical protein
MKIRIYHLHLMEDPDKANAYPSYGQVRSVSNAIGVFLQNVHCQRIDKHLHSQPYEDTTEDRINNRYRGKGVLIDETIGPVPKQGRYLLVLDVLMAGEETLLDKIVHAMDKEIQTKTKYLSSLVSYKSKPLEVPDNFYVAFHSVQELQEQTGVVVG